MAGNIDYSALDDSPARLAAAANNYRLLKDDWCECDTQTDMAYYRDPKTGSHGWMCGKCRCIIQTG